MGSLVFDIETGPLPWAEIEPLYVAPERLPPWSDDMVKYGNTKDPAKRQEKYNEVKAAYAAELAAETQKLADHKSQWAADAALSPTTGQVLAIGARTANGEAILGVDGESESEILEQWWDLYRTQRNKGADFVGYCSNFFDVPFIVWRSYKHGIFVPESVWDKTGRYFGYHFIDLFDRLPKRGFDQVSRKLGDICQWLGIGGKPEGVDGGMFARLWLGTADERQQAIAYALNDLDMTWKLGKRMGVI